MPKPKSEAQRRLVHAAAQPGPRGAAVRKRTGLSLKAAKAGAREDVGGRLPERIRSKGRRAK